MEQDRGGNKEHRLVEKQPQMVRSESKMMRMESEEFGDSNFGNDNENA